MEGLELRTSQPKQETNEHSPAGFKLTTAPPPSSSLTEKQSAEAGEKENNGAESCAPKRTKKKISFWRYILMYHRNEVTALLALGFTLLSTFIQTQSAKEKLRRRSPPPAQRFFPSVSPVLDLYQGNGGDTLTLTSRSEIVMLLYYAPWCAQCLEARWHMDKLARYFSDAQVAFVAVNCWDPGGRCKQSYKLYTYPVLAVFPGTRQPLFYTGHISVDYMYKFLDAVLNPLVRLQNSEEIDDFLATADVCLISFFDFLSFPDPPGYLSYHKTALRYLEKDPTQAIRFGVVTDPGLAESALNMTRNRELRLYQLRHFYEDSDFISFPANLPFKSAEILKWIVNTLEHQRYTEGPVVSWIPVGAQVGQKNDHLQDVLREGAVAILFTPRNPLSESSGFTDDFGVFRTVALEYADCSWGDLPRMKRARWWTREKVDQRRKTLAKWADQCRNIVKRERKLKSCCQELVLTTVYAAVHRNICDICLSSPDRSEDRNNFKSQVCLSRGELFAAHSAEDSDALNAAVSGHFCDELSEFVPAATLVDYCCHQTSVKLGVRNIIFDRSGNLMRSEKKVKCNRKCLLAEESDHDSDKDACQRLRLTKLLGHQLFSDFKVESVFDSEASRDFYGLGCETNRTLRFLAMDSRHYSWLADKLGSGSSRESKLVIAENSSESLFVLRENVTLSSVRDLVKNFTFGQLKAVLKGDEIGTSRHRRNVKNDLKRTVIRIQRVTAKNFQEVVLNSGKDVLLFYSGGIWCGFCTAVNHVLLSVASYFRDLTDHLVVARVDASANDLPWEYTVDRYPSLILFPRNRTSESMRFPEFLPITLPNLLSFLLAHSNPEVKWQVALGVCSRRCLKRNRFNVIKRLDTFRTDIRILKAQLRDSVREKLSMEEYESELEMDEDLVEIFVRQLGRDLAKMELEKRVMKALLKLIQNLDSIREKNGSRVESTIQELLGKVLVFSKKYTIIRTDSTY